MDYIIQRIYIVILYQCSEHYLFKKNIILCWFFYNISIFCDKMSFKTVIFKYSQPIKIEVLSNDPLKITDNIPKFSLVIGQLILILKLITQD